jgi:hypothetical protein
MLERGKSKQTKRMLTMLQVEEKYNKKRERHTLKHKRNIIHGTTLTSLTMR